MKTSNLDIIKKYVDCADHEVVEYIDISRYDASKPTILIIDDFNSIIRLFKRLVDRMDLTKYFNVLYSSGEDAILKVLKTIYCTKTIDIQIDFIIADITFGGAIKVNNELQSFTGIEFVGIIKQLNPNVIFKFITGHNIDPDGTPEFYKQYSEYSSDELLNHVSYKDTPITTNFKLILDLIKGTPYEHLIETEKYIS